MSFVSKRSTNPKRQQLSLSPSRTRSISKSSRTCRNSKLLSELQITETHLLQNKDKLKTCLQIYSMLDVQSQQQRCLLHNNVLSLYCFNQRRVLCVNCIYGVHKHRTHKVLPLKDCIHEIEADNQKLRNLIDNQIRRLQVYSKIAGDNFQILENQLIKSIKNLNTEYQKKEIELKRSYQIAKSEIEQIYEPLINKCSKVQKIFQEFKFHIWEGITKFGDRNMNQDSQIMKQIFYVSIVELAEVKTRAITQKQIQQLERRTKAQI